MANIDPKFIVKLQGKEFVTFNGLIDLAHQKGLMSLEVDIVQLPTEENNMTAICTATAKTKDGIYTDIGDASPGSVNRMIVPHIIRMASTRAKARALRDLTNVGMTAIEELMDEEEQKEPLEFTKKSVTEFKKDRAAMKKHPDDLICSDCGVGITEKVSSYSKSKYGRPLCFDCQKK